MSDGFRKDIFRKILFVALIESRLGSADGIIEDFLLSGLLYFTSETERFPFACCNFGIVTVSTLRKLARPSVSASVSWLQLLQQFRFFVVKRVRDAAFVAFTSGAIGWSIYDDGRPFFVSNGSIDFDVDNVFLDGACISVDDDGDSSDLMVDGSDPLLEKIENEKNVNSMHRC